MGYALSGSCKTCVICGGKAKKSAGKADKKSPNRRKNPTFSGKNF
jgi:hypothetical protein